MSDDEGNPDSLGSGLKSINSLGDCNINLAGGLAL